MIPAQMLMAERISVIGGNIARDIAVDKSFTQARSTGNVTQNSFSNVQPTGDNTTFVAIICYDARGANNRVLSITGVADSWSKLDGYTYSDNIDGTNTHNVDIEVWIGKQAVRNGTPGTITINHGDGTTSAPVSEVAMGRLLAFTGLAASVTDANANAYKGTNKTHQVDGDALAAVQLTGHSSNALGGLEYAVVVHQSDIFHTSWSGFSTPAGWTSTANLHIENVFTLDMVFAWKVFTGAAINNATVGSFGSVAWWGIRAGILTGAAS